ncbi:synaptonemal complex central element protein 2 [Sphaerodactylus townsendi]|uniref:synaptonemal complex central element protein 2 n=1 Tax=Sphaerodactylus townsendi TaxID=933632 RepID=UPI0020264233|nr:synaptonemal complex central element protein 2 [Sphaerodactylus townsendi]
MAAVSNQEFQLLEQKQDHDKPDSPFFVNLEKNELIETPPRKEHPNTHDLSSKAKADGPKSKSSNYFAALDSTTKSLEERVQQLIDKINENRKKDHMLMNNFRESLLMKVSTLADKLEERLFLVYDQNNKLIQDKVQEFSAIVGRIKQMEAELRQVCHTVEMLYKDLCA